MDGNAVYVLTVAMTAVFALIFILYVISVSPGTGGSTPYHDAPKCECGAPMPNINYGPDFDMESYGKYLAEKNGLPNDYKWDFALCRFCNVFRNVFQRRGPKKRGPIIRNNLNA